MKKFKITWILAGVLLLLGVYVYVFEIVGAKKREAKKEKEEKVLVFEKDQVESIRLQTAKGTFFAKRIGEKEWLLEEPLKVPADMLAWNNIVDNLFDVKFNRVISDKSDDLVPYGLKDPKVSIELHFKNKDKKTLYLGDDNPIGDSLFATKDRSQVILLPQYIVSYFDKELKDYREKKLFSFDQAAVKEIEIFEKKTRKIVLKKEGDKWFLLSQNKKEANSDKVSEFLGAVNFLEVRQFEEEDPKDLSKYGLKEPVYHMILRNEKTTQLELLVGSKKDHNVYIARASEKPIYQVNDSLLNSLPLDPQKLVKKEEKKEDIKSQK